MKLRGRRSRRGMTLLESVMAMSILSVGVVAVFGTVRQVTSANRTMAFQSSAVDTLSEVAAQIRDAQCDFPSEAAIPGAPDFTAATIDPGLSGFIDAGWVDTSAGPVTGSGIQKVGVIPNVVPPLFVDYRISSEAVVVDTSLNPITGFEPANVPGLNVEVRVREITNDPARDAVLLEDGYWIQIFPVKKVCNVRMEDSSRGEYL